MSFFPTPDNAISLAFRRDSWLWAKVLVALTLGWLFFLPILWKIGVIAVGLVVCNFSYPCPAGEGVTTLDLAAMIFIHGVVLYSVGWYAIYTIAFLCSPGWKNKSLALAAVVLSPVLMILVALLAVGAAALLGVPMEEIWAFTNRWTPFASWRVTP